MRHRLPATVLGLSAALLGVPVWASQGRHPIHKETVITAPGSYYLTRDIAYDSGTVIDIQANDVTVDLDGHTISSSVGTNVLIGAVGRTNLRVTNGKLVGGNKGVSLTVGGGGPQIFVQIDDLNVRGQSGGSSKGIHVSGDPTGSKAVVVVERNTVDGSGTAAICIELDYITNSVVENNIAQNSWTPTTGIGLSVGASLGGRSERVKLKGNVVSGNRYGGLSCTCNGSDVSYNVASGNGGGSNVATGVGILGNDNSVSYNTSSKNSNGITIQGSGNAVSHNTASENSAGSVAGTGYGIWINNGNGPACQYNVVEFNRCSMNYNFGIYIGNAADTNNCIRNNSTPQASGTGRSMVAGQLCDSNNLP